LSTPSRRFPPPWRVDDAGDGEVLRVVDADEQILAYVLYEDESVCRDLMERLTKNEARRIAVNIAKLPELLGSAAITSALRRAANIW
jgi:hypothetical protein